MDLPQIDAHTPILIAGPTASGKSELALRLAETYGGVVVNADASQVFDCWRVITARPPAEDEARARHLLYGHVEYNRDYSAGHWLREVTALLHGPERYPDRLIIVGGTGLYFSTLTKGMADIPATPADVRQRADSIPLPDLIAELDTTTAERLDLNNRMRVQRAWEVQCATGRPLAQWQDETPPPLLPPERCITLNMVSDKDWLEARIRRRFDLMLEAGALEEIDAMLDLYDPELPSCKAIGVPELMAYRHGKLSLDDARESASVATRQFAKRQRTWFRSKMKDWHQVSPDWRP